MAQMPPFYTSAFANASQNNFQQQHEINPQQMQPSSFNPFIMNQQGPNVQNQPYQADSFGNQQPILNSNVRTHTYQQISNPHSALPGLHNQNCCGCLPANIFEQIRSCINTAPPILILSSACPTASPTTSQMHPTSIMGHNMTYSINNPQMGMPYSQSPSFCYAPSCNPYPLPIPIYDHFFHHNYHNEKAQNCGCCQKINAVKESFKNSNFSNEIEDHKCAESKDDTICTKKDCPSSLNLQALASQFLSIRGIIPWAATRLVLRKIPGSNVTTSADETIDRAQKAIHRLNKDKLLCESRNAQQVNALINLHMTANPPPNIIPILTMIQLKVNLLKAQVENLINNKLLENQGFGSEGACHLDPLLFALKTDAELREFLATLRQKECEERVNLNFAPFYAQRVIAENRLTNIQNKILQVETEMEGRQRDSMRRTSISNRKQHQFSEPCVNFNNSASFDLQMQSTSVSSPIQTHESPDPFIIEVRSPKRLNLKPHVGSPETTYEYSRGAGKDVKNDNQIQNCEQCFSTSQFTNSAIDTTQEEVIKTLGEN